MVIAQSLGAITDGLVSGVSGENITLLRLFSYRKNSYYDKSKVKFGIEKSLFIYPHVNASNSICLIVCLACLEPLLGFWSLKSYLYTIKL